MAQADRPAAGGHVVAGGPGPDGGRQPDGRRGPDGGRQPDGRRGPDGSGQPDGRRGPDGSGGPQGWRIGEDVSVCARLRHHIAAVTGHSPTRITPATALAELGLDSLMAVRIRAALEREFSIELPLRDLLGAATVEDAAARIMRALPRETMPPGDVERPVSPTRAASAADLRAQPPGPAPAGSIHAVPSAKAQGATPPTRTPRPPGAVGKASPTRPEGASRAVARCAPAPSPAGAPWGLPAPPGPSACAPGPPAAPAPTGPPAPQTLP
ncbi:acyl carrier protein, partial [Streptomyces europaeiscabiei]|uniref:acyl carrier protein n=1 Tax=Streptomyces europaeiscabiei TaxID=146819 RepID=UPI0038D3E381